MEYILVTINFTQLIVQQTRIKLQTVLLYKSRVPLLHFRVTTPMGHYYCTAKSFFLGFRPWSHLTSSHRRSPRAAIATGERIRRACRNERPEKTTGGNDGTHDPTESRRCDDVFRIRGSDRHGDGLTSRVSLAGFTPVPPHRRLKPSTSERRTEQRSRKDGQAGRRVPPQKQANGSRQWAVEPKRIEAQPAGCASFAVRPLLATGAHAIGS